MHAHEYFLRNVFCVGNVVRPENRRREPEHRFAVTPHQFGEGRWVRPVAVASDERFIGVHDSRVSVRTVRPGSSTGSGRRPVAQWEWGTATRGTTRGPRRFAA